MYRKSRTAVRGSHATIVSGTVSNHIQTKASGSYSDIVIRVHAICLGTVGREVLQIAVDTRVPCCIGFLHRIDDGDSVLAGQKGILRQVCLSDPPGVLSSKCDGQASPVLTSPGSSELRP